MHIQHGLLLACVLSIAGVQPVLADTQQQEQFNRIHSQIEKSALVQGGSLAALKSKYDGHIKTDKQLRNALHELASLAHGEVLSPEQSKDWLCRRGGGYIGLGISYEPFHLVGSSGIVIKKVIPESTAEDAGLKDGDRILLVNGKSLDGLIFRDAVDKIQGPDGSFVELTVDDGTAIKAVSVKRDLDQRIGVEIQLDKPRILVNLGFVFHDSPAHKAGLREGDLIYKVGGTPVEAIDFEKFASALNVEEIGDKTQFTVLRDGKELEIEVVTGLVSNWSDSFSIRGQSSNSSDPRHNFWLMGIENLDFDGLPELSSLYQSSYDQNGRAAIIDLRGCSGDDPELAAKVLAGFMGGASGDLLFVRERVNGKEVTTQYSIRNGALVRLRDGQDAEVIDFDLPESYFTGKLAVIVDRNTSGTAEAVAYALQRWRNARIVGERTNCRAVLKAHTKLDDGTYVSYQSGRLLDAQGKVLNGVEVDRSVWMGSDPVETAKKEIAGVYWYNDIDTIIAYFVAPGMFLLVIVIFGLANRSRMNRIQSSEAAEQEVSPVVSVSEPVEQQEVSESTDSKSTALSKKWQICFPLAVVIGFFAMLFLLPPLMKGPPSGTYCKVTVEYFTDGSDELKNQQAVIDQLASEYSGSIEFKTIDVVKNPHLNQGTDAVKNIPSIRVSKRWFDKNGVVISGSSLTWGGKVPKRDLVPTIEGAAQSNRDYWPDAEITRTKAPRP